MAEESSGFPSQAHPASDQLNHVWALISWELRIRPVVRVLLRSLPSPRAWDGSRYVSKMNPRCTAWRVNCLSTSACDESEWKAKATGLWATIELLDSVCARCVIDGNNPLAGRQHPSCRYSLLCRSLCLKELQSLEYCFKAH